MSIVIVIVGLLIGGILVGQSLIESAKINTLVSNFQQYEIAFLNFKQKFNQIPGDSNLFTPGGTNNKVVSGNEGIYAIHHLQKSGMINDNLSYDTNIDKINWSGTVAPDFGYKNSTILLNTSHLYGFIESKPQCKYWFRMAKYRSETYSNLGNIYRSGAVNSQVGNSLDKKIDDGMPLTGNLMSVTGLNSTVYTDSNSGNCVNHSGDPTTEKYRVSSDKNSCVVYYCVRND